jgi:hypothetical protein
MEKPVLTLLMLVLACGPKKPVENDVEPVDVATSPVVPALQAPTYQARQTLPKDDLVAQVALGMVWDEALSGAAAALAMSEVTPSLAAAQHAAHRAGFPYPVRVVSSGSVPAGRHPDALLRTLHKVMGKTDRLGLARIRRGLYDHWVALVSAPVDTLEPFHREQPLNTEIQIRTVGPGTWMAVSPSGVVKSGRMPASLGLDEEGEWWVEVDGLHDLIAAVPIYVGMPTPPSPIVPLPGESFAGPVAAADEALLLVSSIREVFSMSSLRDDGTLETLAQYPLELLLSGQWDRETGMGRLQAAGFVGGPVGQVQCQGATVATCVDGMLRSGRERELLLNPAFRIGGAAAQVSTEGVTIVVNMASE